MAADGHPGRRLQISIRRRIACDPYTWPRAAVQQRDAPDQQTEGEAPDPEGAPDEPLEDEALYLEGVRACNA